MASAVLAGAGVDSAAERVSSLHAEYGDAVYRYCRRHLRSREDAEDATQVVFMNAYRSLARGAVPMSESAWLFKIAENAVLYRRRRIVARERVEVPVPDSVIDSLNPALTAETYGAGRQIVEALGRMPLDQQRAIVLREWQGLAYREVAETLGVSETTAAMLVIRARAVLARELERPSVFRRLGLGWLGWLLAPLDRIAIGSVATKAAAGLAGAAAVALPVGTVIAKMPTRHVQAVPAHTGIHRASSHHARTTAARHVAWFATQPSTRSSSAPIAPARPKAARLADAPTGAAAASAPTGATPASDPLAPEPATPTAQAPAGPAAGTGDPTAAAPVTAPQPDAVAAAADTPAAAPVDAPAGTPADPSPAHGSSGKPHPVHPVQAQNVDPPSANAPGQTGVPPASSQRP